MKLMIPAVEIEVERLHIENKRLKEALMIIYNFPPKDYPRRTKDGYPSEIIYDEFSYKRIINTYRDVARLALRMRKAKP